MKKLIKQFTPEEKKEYRRNAYLKRREKQLQEQKVYYEAHKDEISFKNKNRYRAKFGLAPLKREVENGN